MDRKCKKWLMLFLASFFILSSVAVVVADAQGGLKVEAQTVQTASWSKVNGKWYYFDVNGNLAVGWKFINNKWYYFDSANVMVTGWQQIAGKWYYMRPDGDMVTGWQQIAGKWYYMNANGEMTTGWQKVAGKWYYMKLNGQMTVGWQQIAGKWYYMNVYGEMTTGWQRIDSQWYYMNADGMMMTGWRKIDNKWYYLKLNGQMATGWLKLGTNWYYLDGNGEMAVGQKVIGNKIYTFDSDGVWQEPTDESTLITPLVNTPKHVTVHDPSIVKDPKSGMYYIFGSHMAWARSKDLVNWETFSMNINSNYRTIFEEPAQWAAKGSATYDVSGNLWAPDVIYNEKMGKWCMYMSVNGDSWYSSIVLLTANSIGGPYTYVGPVVYSGFRNSADAALTDYSKVMGNNDVPSRYTENRNGNMTYSLNAIDPCVLYDDDGNLWMSYGSWFGGLYMIKLDPETGLRDYTMKYDLVTNQSDPYLGIKIAGGYHSSGEASYIQKVGNYYYLYVTLGGLAQRGGYNMRVFRSEAITGPYVDVSGDKSVYTSYYNNVNGNRGQRLMSQYRWNYMSYGYVAQGHNSSFVDDDGKAYLIYHTRFDNQGEGHQVRVHQLFTNEDGWLVTAPFEYYGETLPKSGYTTDQVAGAYEVLFQTNNIDFANLECVTGKTLVLDKDGTVTGEKEGTWSWSEALGSPYVDLKLGSVTYRGVFIEQKMEESTDVTMCLTVLGSDEMAIWGYRFQPDDAVSMAADALTVPYGTIADLALPKKGICGTTITWTSSDETIISTNGSFTAPAKDTEVTLTATISCGDASKDVKFPVMAYAGKNNKNDLLLYSYYTSGSLNLAATGEGTNRYPNWFNKNVVNGLDIYNGVSIEFDVIRNSNSSIFSNILSFNSGEKGGLYFTGGSYLGYNATGGFFDANLRNGSYTTNPWTSGKDLIGSGSKKHIKIDILPDGFVVYVDDVVAYTNNDVGSDNIPGQISIDSYASVLSYLNNTATTFNLGWGSWWDDKFNGTIANVKLWAKGVVYEDTSAYVYYEDFSRQPENYWTVANTSDIKQSYQTSSDKYGIYTNFAANTGVSGNRGAYAMFPEEISGNYTIEVDVALTAGILTQRSMSGFAILGKDASGHTGNSIVSSGYILKLVNQPPVGTKPNQSDKSLQNIWKINDTDETVEIPVGEWVTIKVQVNTSTGKALLTITNRSTGAAICENKEITTNGTGTLGGLQFLRGRGVGAGSVDTIKVTAVE